MGVVTKTFRHPRITRNAQLLRSQGGVSGTGRISGHYGLHQKNSSEPSRILAQDPRHKMVAVATGLRRALANHPTAEGSGASVQQQIIPEAVRCTRPERGSWRG